VTVPRPSDRLKLHTALAIGLAICLVGFVVELERGLDGHVPAWVYVLEWPLFAAGGVFVWWRLLRDDVAVEAPKEDPPVSDGPGLDVGLDAWRDYVRRLESREARDSSQP
jgi:hypothetical protein